MLQAWQPPAPNTHYTLKLFIKTRYLRFSQAELKPILKASNSNSPDSRPAYSLSAHLPIFCVFFRLDYILFLTRSQRRYWQTQCILILPTCNWRVTFRKIPTFSCTNLVCLSYCNSLHYYKDMNFSPWVFFTLFFCMSAFRS